MTELKDLILLGMRKQLKTRNKVLLECLTVLADIMPPGIPQIVNRYIYGDDQHIDPDAADAFLNEHYEASKDSIGMAIELMEPRCNHGCCYSVIALDVSVIVHDWDDSGSSFPLNYMWNYVVSSYDDEICSSIANTIKQGKTDRDEAASIPECKKIARELLDDIRQQIILAGNEDQ